MEEERNTEPQDITSRAISLIFHPLLMPLYGMIIIFTAPTFLSYIPLKVKFILLSLLVLNNILLPFFSLLPFFRYKNRISGTISTTRKGRIIPLISFSVFFFISSFIMFSLPIPGFLKLYILSIAIISTITTIINLWWKISLYSVGAGILTAIVVVLSLNMMVLLTWFLIPALLIAGLVLSSRLKLNAHNSLQVYLGFITGFSGIIIILLLFQ